MIKATEVDKPLVIQILTSSFHDNKSVNFIVKQDENWFRRIQALMAYSFEVCIRFGKVYLSDDRAACALVLFPDEKKTTLDAILLDIQLVFATIGLNRVFKVLGRESKVKKLHPKERLYYIWFIGVDPQYHRLGIGSKLLKEILSDAKSRDRMPCLETSTPRNVPWYQSFGFEFYDQLDLGYTLYFLKLTQTIN